MPLHPRRHLERRGFHLQEAFQLEIGPDAFYGRPPHIQREAPGRETVSVPPGLTNHHIYLRTKGAGVAQPREP